MHINETKAFLTETTIPNDESFSEADIFTGCSAGLTPAERLEVLSYGLISRWIPGVQQSRFTSDVKLEELILNHGVEGQRLISAFRVLNSTNLSQSQLENELSSLPTQVSAELALKLLKHKYSPQSPASTLRSISDQNLISYVEDPSTAILMLIDMEKYDLPEQTYRMILDKALEAKYYDFQRSNLCRLFVSGAMLAEDVKSQMKEGASTAPTSWKIEILKMIADLDNRINQKQNYSCSEGMNLETKRSRMNEAIDEIEKKTGLKIRSNKMNSLGVLKDSDKKLQNKCDKLKTKLWLDHHLRLFKQQTEQRASYMGGGPPHDCGLLITIEQKSKKLKGSKKSVKILEVTVRSVLPNSLIIKFDTNRDDLDIILYKKLMEQMTTHTGSTTPKRLETTPKAPNSGR